MTVLNGETLGSLILGSRDARDADGAVLGAECRLVRNLYLIRRCLRFLKRKHLRITLVRSADSLSQVCDLGAVTGYRH